MTPSPHYREQLRHYGEPFAALPAHLQDALPHDKHDHAAVERWLALDEPGRACLVPFLLTWLQDINWPVARAVLAALLPMGEALTPYLESLLRCDDDIWRYWILSALVPALPREVAVALTPILTELAAAPNEDEVDLAAQELLDALAAGAWPADARLDW